MTTITAERAVAVGCVHEKVGISTRDPATIEHLAANISLNEFEKEIKLGPGQSRATDDSEGVARPRRE
jgi:hypothetical protein